MVTDAECWACKSASGILRGLFNLEFIKSEIFVFAILGCKVGVAPIVGYSPEICTDIVKTQFEESIYPVIFDELLNEMNMCTFVFNFC